MKRYFISMSYKTLHKIYNYTTIITVENKGIEENFNTVFKQAIEAVNKLNNINTTEADWQVISFNNVE